jgi:FkbM family methyltransferase
MANMSEGVAIEFLYRETLGRTVLIHGDFEFEERNRLSNYVRPGTVAVDVGANIGVFTTSLAKALEGTGTVMAFEPIPDNVTRLRRNVSLNGLGNVKVYSHAVGAAIGEVEIHIAADPAYHSVTNRSEHAISRTGHLRVPITELDTVWESSGQPSVSVLKIDVEGAELDVLRGAERLLRDCKPVVLLEAENSSSLRELDTYLQSYGYFRCRSDGFMPWNHLYLVNARDDRSALNEQSTGTR